MRKKRPIYEKNLSEIEPFHTRDQVIAYLDQPRITCLLCGLRYRRLSTHLAETHNVPPDDYRMALGLPLSRGLVGTETRGRHSAAMKSRWEAGELDDHRNRLPELAAIAHAANASAPPLYMPEYRRAELRERMLSFVTPRTTPRPVRRPLRTLSRAELSLAVLAVEEGASLRQAAKSIGASITGMQGALKRHPDLLAAVNAVILPPRVISREEIEQVIVDIERGLSIRRACAGAAITPQGLSSAARRHPDLEARLVPFRKTRP